MNKEHKGITSKFSGFAELEEEHIRDFVMPLKKGADPSFKYSVVRDVPGKDIDIIEMRDYVATKNGEYSAKHFGVSLFANGLAMKGEHTDVVAMSIDAKQNGISEKIMVHDVEPQVQVMQSGESITIMVPKNQIISTYA